MSTLTNPRLAAMAPAAVYIKSTTTLSNEEAASFIKSYVTSSEDMVNVAANTALTLDSAAGTSSAIVDAMASEMAQNEKIVAQLKRAEATLHSYSHTSYDYSESQAQNTSDIGMDESVTDTTSEKPISKEERKRLKKERKKQARKDELEKKNDDEE